MSVFTKLANAIFSPVDDAGNQRSVANGDAQMWGTELERLIMALVAEASDLELPNLLIRYTITGGTANAIEATTNLPIPSAPGEALYAIQIAQDNTGPVTINGKRWLTNVGNEFVAGGIKAGGIYLFLDNGTHYRAITDQDVSALVAQAEADADRAEAARDAAVAALSSVVAPKATLALAIADDPDVDPDYYDIAYRDTSYVAGSGGKYRKQASEPTHALKFQNANGTWYGFEGERLAPQMFGAIGVSAAADTLLFQNMFATALAIEAKECDARSVTGTITFTADIFNGMHTLPLVFRTRDLVMRMDFNGKSFKLPSLFKWEPEGGRVEPTAFINSIDGENSPGCSLVETYFGGQGRTCSGSGSTLTVSDATGIHVGTQVAVFGTEIDFNFQFSLGANVNPSDTTIQIVGSGTSVADAITPCFATFRVSGTEFIRGLLTSGGILDTAVSGGGRGQLGGSAQSHTSGASVVLMQSRVHTVTAMAGNVLTVTPDVGVGHTNGQFRFGSVGSEIDGRLEIDGRYDRSVPTTAVWSCLGSTLSNDFRVGGGITLRRAPTGGYFMLGTKNVKLDIDRIDQGGRPAINIGGSGWLYGKNVGSNIHVKLATDGYIANIVDNKSSGVIFFGLDQPNRDFNVVFDTILTHKVGHDVTASFDGYCFTGYSDCSDTHAGIFDGLPQQWAAIPPTGVTIEIGKMKAFKLPTGTDVNSNVVILEGERERVSRNVQAIGSPVAISANNGTEIIMSLPGAKVGDTATVNPTSVLPYGLSIASAQVIADDAVVVRFANALTTSTNVPPNSYRLRAEGPWL